MGFRILLVFLSVFVGAFSYNAFACKPCGDALEYSVRNNSLAFTGTTVFVGEAPEYVVMANAKEESMYKHKRYCIDVHVKVDEVFHKRAEDKIVSGQIFKTQSCYNPPCKGISLPKVGESKFFFPEDYGNCSSFSFDNTQSMRDQFLPLLKAKYPDLNEKKSSKKLRGPPPESFSISALVKYHQKGLKFATEAYVSYQHTCPPCPKDAMCEPCRKNHIIISETLHKNRTLDNMSSGDMLLYLNESFPIETGKKYRFNIEYQDVQFPEKSRPMYIGNLLSIEDVKDTK